MPPARQGLYNGPSLVRKGPTMPTIDPNLLPVDILRMALEREKEAYAFYTEAAGLVAIPTSEKEPPEKLEVEASRATDVLTETLPVSIVELSGAPAPEARRFPASKSP